MRYIATEETVCVMASREELLKAFTNKTEFDKFIIKLEEATETPLRYAYELAMKSE